MLFIFSLNSYSEECERDLSETQPDMGFVADIPVKKCLTKTRSAKKACKCNKDNKKHQLHNKEDFPDTLKTLQKNNAIASMDQLRKNLTAISNELMSLDVLSNEQNVAACNLKSLEDRFKKCTNKNSLYSLIKNDNNHNIKSVTAKVKDDLSSYYKPFAKKGYPQVSCNLADAITTKIANKTHLETFQLILENIEFKEGVSIEDQVSAFIGKSNEFPDLEEKFNHLKRNPLFRSIIYKPDLTKEVLSHKPVNTIFSDNQKIKDNIISELTKKCEESYNKAFENLCMTDSNASILGDYKDFQKRTKATYKEVESPEQESRYTQAVIYFCKERDKKDNIDLSAQNKDLNAILNLPEGLAKQSHKKFEERKYIVHQHDVRIEICDSIPPQGDLDKSISEQCKEGHSNKCSYLMSYKELIEEAHSKKLAKDSKDKKKKENPDNNVADSDQVDTELGAINFSPESIMGMFQHKSELISNFIGEAPVKEEVQVKSEVKVTQTDNSNNNNNNVNSNSGSTVKNSTGGANNAGTGPSNLAGNSFASNGPSNNSNVNNAFNANNSYSSPNSSNSYQNIKSRDNSFFKRMFKKKPKNSKVDEELDAISKARREVASTVETLKDYQRSKQSEQWEEDYTDNLMASTLPGSSEDFYSPEDVEDFLDEQQAIDSHQKPNTIQSIIDKFKRKEANLPPYQMRKVNGDIAKLPGLEVGSITNTNFEGAVGEEIPEVSLYGSLAEDLATMDPEEVLTYDPTKGGVDELASLVKEKKTFVISNNGDDSQRILAKADALGNYTFLVRMEYQDDYGETQEKYVDFKEAKRKLPKEFRKFYKNVSNAFDNGLVKKMYDFALLSK